MIDCGIVIESKSEQGQSVVTVDILGRKTNWLPVLQEANSFKRKVSPVRVGTQVVVLLNRYVIGAIFNKESPEPSGANGHCEVCEYEDGTRISYDSKAKELNIKGVGDMTINLDGNAVVNAKNIHLNEGKGVVTGAHICAFTGLPHSDCSSCVTAGK